MEPAASFEIRTRRWGLRRMSRLRTMRGGGDLHEFDHQLDVCGFSEANLNPVGAAARAQPHAIVNSQGGAPAPDLNPSEAHIDDIVGVEVEDLLAVDPVAVLRANADSPSSTS